MMELLHSGSIFLLFYFLIITIYIAKSDSNYDSGLRRISYDSCKKELEPTTIPNNSSTYNTTISTLLHDLSSNARNNPTGFYNTSVRDNNINSTTNINGYYLCRGDLDNGLCYACVSTAANNMNRSSECMRRKRSIIYYNQCMIRYSDEISLALESSETAVEENGNDLSGKIHDLKILLGKMFHDLIIQAANDDDDKTGRKFAATSMSVDLTTLYAMAQCKPDLSVALCQTCLTNAAAKLRATDVGENFLTPNCNVRYEIYPFLNSMDYFSPSGTTTTGKKNTVTKKVVPVITVLAIVGMVIALGTYFYRKKAKRYPSTDVQNVLQELTTAESLMFKLETLEVATTNFSDNQKLGQGGFGSVYKGTLSNGQEIAVKRLSKISGQGVEEFKNEVVLIANLQHKNLVKLLGFCLAGMEKLLVYEFVPNKSLDYFLFDPAKQGELNWPTRYNIIKGIARGLLYLHEDSRPRIIHRDLKAGNILLDATMDPKIADFGLARMFKVEQTEADTNRVVGTYGYMSPEYAMHGQFSVKSDVYSFGVLVLEIISGKRINARFNPSEAGDLLTHAWRSLTEENPLRFMDPTLNDSYLSGEVLRCIHLGLSCAQESTHQRPTMSTIVSFMLYGDNDSTNGSLPTPECPRSFYTSSIESSVVTRLSQQSTMTCRTSDNSMPSSSNQITISDDFCSR